jgi:hypothetical protein
MNATRPRAKTEYSRGSEASEGADTGVSGDGSGSRTSGGAVARAVLAGGLFGALLLLAAEFTTLFEIRTAASSTAVRSVGTGSHHAFALVPIALLVILLAYAVRSAGSRPALLAIGLMGLIALLIALLGDLPDAHATGLVGSASTHYVAASSTPSAGLYLETLGAVVLLITTACGLLLIGPLRDARAAHHTGPGAAVGQPSRPQM